LYASLSELQKPIKSIVLQFKGQPGALEVQKPELEVAEVRADVEIPDGSTVLFELPRKADRHLIVLITARRQIADPPDPADHKDR
jgi:hypothetical protein